MAWAWTNRSDRFPRATGSIAAARTSRFHGASRALRHFAAAVASGGGLAMVCLPHAVAQPAAGAVRDLAAPPAGRVATAPPAPRAGSIANARPEVLAATTAALARIGRAATPAELRAWDIDVRGDFAGLPPGSGSVALGEKVWEAKCASCHGIFGESNEVFTPLIGGTTKQDVETGRVGNLVSGGHPHRTTLMRASRLSTLWDYMHRAMPWNAPKSLSADEVYGVLAYMLSLGEVVPADFTLSDRNIAATERRLPNRNGKVFFRDLWEVGGKGDVANTACMRDCPVDGRLAAALPDAARNANGNIAEQVRPFGPARGTDTSAPPATEPVRARRQGASAADAAVTFAAATSIATGSSPPSTVAPPVDLLQANACTACHARAAGCSDRHSGRSRRAMSGVPTRSTTSPAASAAAARASGVRSRCPVRPG